MIDAIICLKYLRFTPAGCWDRGINKLEFVAKTQFLCCNFLTFKHILNLPCVYIYWMTHLLTEGKVPIYATILTQLCNLLVFLVLVRSANIKKYNLFVYKLEIHYRFFLLNGSFIKGVKVILEFNLKVFIDSFFLIEKEKCLAFFIPLNLFYGIQVLTNY